jgi:glycosyltransferase involved in cell wall biosynthesis
MMNRDNASKRPIRILELRGTYKGGGGPDKTILLSAQRHDKDRIFILVTYLRDPRDMEFEITERAKKHGICFEEVHDRTILDLSCLAKLNRLIKRYELELLHAHDDKSLLYGWLLKIINPRLKIIYTCHLYLDYKRSDFPSQITYLNYLLRKRASSFLAKRFLRPIMAVSEATKKQLIKDGLREDEVIVLHNSIDVEFWNQNSGYPVLRDEIQLGTNELLVGTVARIDYQKDFRTFFSVAKLVKLHVPRARFVVVGDGKGDELEKIKESAKEFGVSQDVCFTGHRNDLLNVYSSLDLFLMTSIKEGLPNSILEAMAMGVPVVSTAVDGVPELIAENETGYLCPIGDVETLSNRVITLLEDKNLRSQFAQAGRKRIIENFSFEKRVKQLESVYEYFAMKK